MYKLEFTLKQHTPIIHFQYFLTHATLRSTELKSALDKFIIGEHCGCWSSDKTIRLKAAVDNEEYKKWLKHSREPSNPSFDYDIELIVLEPLNKKLIPANDLKKYGFFGNQPTEKDFNDKAKYKKAIIEKELIKLIIKSPYPELLAEIDNLIAKFFLLKNFGTRQSKGFGCYYPVEKYSYLHSQNILPFYFDVNEQELDVESNKYISVFQIINLFYNTLRSGLNVKEGRPPDLRDHFYFKSLMWAYAKSKNEHWDKKSIKNKYLEEKQTDEDLKWKANSTEYIKLPENFPLGYKDKKGNEMQRHLWRDLLGLSSKEDAGSWKLSKEHDESDKNKKLSRFKSPIIFKPFLVGENQYRVFFGVAPELINQFKEGTAANTEAEILGKNFAVKFNKSGNLKLRYPDKLDFPEYLEFAINKYNADPNWVESDFQDTNEFKIIDSIYKQLKGQVK